jgi:2'-5' RNA ligase
MQFAIVLGFDKIKQIDDAVERIAKEVNPFFTDAGYFPHVTLIVYEADNVDSVKKFFAIRPFKLSIKTKGISGFRGEKSTVFIDIEKDKDLMKLHDKYLRITDIQLSEYSTSENYHPHITLATDLSSEERATAEMIAESIRVPKSITPTHVSLIDATAKPYKVIGNVVIR